jgi:hypothetical protein
MHWCTRALTTETDEPRDPAGPTKSVWRGKIWRAGEPGCGGGETDVLPYSVGILFLRYARLYVYRIAYATERQYKLSTNPFPDP